jgi:putative ABC transport system substrate-binding protein
MLKAGACPSFRNCWGSTLRKYSGSFYPSGADLYATRFEFERALRRGTNQELPTAASPESGEAKPQFSPNARALMTPRSGDIELAVKSRLPASYPTAEFIEAGRLMTYSPNINDLSRRAATFVDKILKGTKPADLPVEQPIKFEFIINLKAAKEIGLTIPPNVLVRAGSGD